MVLNGALIFGKEGNARRKKKKKEEKKEAKAKRMVRKWSEQLYFSDNLRAGSS
jgi:hypothetical protein